MEDPPAPSVRWWDPAAGAAGAGQLLPRCPGIEAIHSLRPRSPAGPWCLAAHQWSPPAPGPPPAALTWQREGDTAGACLLSGRDDDDGLAPLHDSTSSCQFLPSACICTALGSSSYRSRIARTRSPQRPDRARRISVRDARAGSNQNEPCLCSFD